MKKMTEQHLINAFGGESQAHMRYLHFANQAEKEKLNNTARLFRAIAHAEYIHAGDHYRELKHLDEGFVANSMAAFGPGDSKKNLKLAIAGETFEIEEMYPVYLEVAKFQGEKGAQKSFEQGILKDKERISFGKLKHEIIDHGICTLCGACVASCEVLNVVGGKPALKGPCTACGVCY